MNLTTNMSHEDFVGGMIKRTLGKMLLKAYGEGVTVHGYTPYVDRIQSTDNGSIISARVSADLLIKLKGGPIHEAYILKALFSFTPLSLEPSGEARIKLKVRTDGTPEDIAISPTINTPISTVTNIPISLTSSDFDILMGIETDPVFILGEKKGVR